MDQQFRPALPRPAVGVSVKLELRNERAGEVARRNGCAWSASSITPTWSGKVGAQQRAPDADALRRPVRRCRSGPVRRKRKLPSAWAKPSRNARCGNPAARRPIVGREIVEAAKPALVEHIVDMLPLGHAEAGQIADPQPPGKLFDDGNDCSAGPRADRSASAPARCAGCRRRGRCRRAPGTWSPATPRRPACAVSVMNCSCTQTNRSSRRNPRRTSRCSGATLAGLVFWIEHRRHRRPAIQRAGIADEDRADARLVEVADCADRGSAGPRSGLLSSLKMSGVGMEGAAALIGARRR